MLAYNFVIFNNICTRTHHLVVEFCSRCNVSFAKLLKRKVYMICVCLHSRVIIIVVFHCSMTAAPAAKAFVDHVLSRSKEHC